MDDLLPPIKDLIPVDKELLLGEIGDINELGGATLILLNKLLDNFYSGKIIKGLASSKILLDFIWEKLNTGHWKDVKLSWRLAYSVVAFIKALCECCILTANDSSNLQTRTSEDKSSKPRSTSLSPKDAVKTCDMGLLMGAPILDNLLARLAKAIQLVFLTTSSVNCAGFSDEEQQNKKTDSESECECDGLCVTEVQTNTKSDQSKFSPNGGNSKKAIGHNQSACKRRKLSQSYKDSFVPKIEPCNQVPCHICPSLDTFKRDFMDSKQPVVIENSIDYWPAFNTRKWSLEYIRQIAGYRTVPIEIGSKYTEDSWTQKLMTIGEFIDVFIERIKGEKEIGYLAQHQLFNQIPELRDDMSIPTYCSISKEVDDDVDVNAWFGPQGTISPLHFDPKHNLLAQVVGEKYIRLYGEEETPKLYPHTGRLLNNTSQVDAENPNLQNFPNFEKANFSECVLQAGQMLYIPPKCWHYVRSLNISFSVSFWWM